MLSLIISIIALGFIVAFHEFGHFITARFFKVGVIEFSVGMGPRLLSGVKGNVRYSLRIFPFGGSCMMLGEEMAEEEGTGRVAGDITNGAFNGIAPTVSGDTITVEGRIYHKSEQFVNKPAWQRFFVIAAGPVFNFILAFVLALIITAHYGYDRADVMDVTAGMPAAEAGIEKGDIITGLAALDDYTENNASDVNASAAKKEKGSEAALSAVHFEKIETGRDIQLYMAVNNKAMQAGKSFAFRFKDASDGYKEKTAVVLPALDEELGRYRLGFSYSTGFLPAESIGEVLYYSLYDVKYCIKNTVYSVKMLIEGSVTKSDVMGPVRMVAVMDESVQTASEGGGTVAAAMTLLNIMIIISGALGATNLLPLPALDGGRLIFIIIELVTGHAVPKRLEGGIHMAGMLLLLALMFFIMFNDITQLIFK